jgi:uncharacterized tellurite resistance protein B-like protein
MSLSPRPDHETREGLVVHDWSVLHDLAFIYLMLAQGTDRELSEAEIQIILRRLQEWKPTLGPDDVLAILHAAQARYSEGLDETALLASIVAVKEGLPERQRMAALGDLIQIANADGVFLDNEEDLINNLMTAWDVDPYATYGRHGEKWVSSWTKKNLKRQPET